MNQAYTTTIEDMRMILESKEKELKKLYANKKKLEESFKKLQALHATNEESLLGVLQNIQSLRTTLAPPQPPQ